MITPGNLCFRRAMPSSLAPVFLRPNTSSPSREPSRSRLASVTAVFRRLSVRRLRMLARNRSPLSVTLVSSRYRPSRFFNLARWRTPTSPICVPVRLIAQTVHGADVAFLVHRMNPEAAKFLYSLVKPIVAPRLQLPPADRNSNPHWEYPLYPKSRKKAALRHRPPEKILIRIEQALSQL